MRIKSLLGPLFAALLATACVSSPKIHKQEAKLTANSQMATLDLRGLDRIKVFQRGEPLGEKKILPAGQLELLVEVGPVRSEQLPCGRNSALVLFADCVTRAMSKASERPRACFTVSVNTIRDKVYRLRLNNRSPVFVEEPSAVTASKTRPVPCSAVDDLRDLP